MDVLQSGVAVSLGSVPCVFQSEAGTDGIAVRRDGKVWSVKLRSAVQQLPWERCEWTLGSCAFYNIRLTQLRTRPPLNSIISARSSNFPPQTIKSPSTCMNLAIWRIGLPAPTHETSCLHEGIAYQNNRRDYPNPGIAYKIAFTILSISQNCLSTE